MEPLKVYACYNTDLDLRMSSSSGAVFSSLASFILSNGGAVYGVSMSDDCYSAEFVRITDNKDLAKLRGSKYLQAKVGDAYKRVKNDVASGKAVLFIGTGCQINGLKCFLGKEYQNLICADIICHGVPSPALWKKFAKYQEKKNGGKITSINFRCKDAQYDDLAAKDVLGNIPQKKIKKVYLPNSKNTYTKMYIRNHNLRPSCYNCAAKKEKLSDITIGDFWGIKKLAPEMSDGKGASLVLIRTKNGTDIFNKIKSDFRAKEISYKDAVSENSSEYKSAEKTALRSSFYTDMNKLSYRALEKKYAAPQFKAPLSYRIGCKINEIRNCLHGTAQAKDESSNEDYGIRFIFRKKH